MCRGRWQRSGDGRRAAVVTDLGEATVELMRHLAGCEHISIEANYDPGKLLAGPYPERLKHRISSRGGHLSNPQTAEILVELLHPDLKSIVLCHLSEKNNAPHLAESEGLLQIGDGFNGDFLLSTQKVPDFSHILVHTDP